MKFERYGIGIVKGLTVTIRHLLRHPTVTQYPEQWLNVSRRIRGNELIWSREKCTGCGTCAKTCPQGAIEIVTSTNLAENKYEVEKYQVDNGYCIQCGLCVEACPYDALYMGYSFERAKYRRGELVQADDMLLESAERPASGYFHPEVAQKLPRQTLLIERITEKR
ncbi:NAD(P)H-quinone oxidoreductase subunit I, chloroplastic [subsurface metagenome]|nr:4Fe-4S dicluster domain-containing protein [Dehalococcoidia bacterium]